MLNAQLFSDVACLGQETGELAEDQNLMPFRNRVPHEFAQHFQLRARSIALAYQGRIQGQLAQQGQRLENLEAIRINVVNQPQNFLPHTLEAAVISFAVPRLQFDFQHLLGLRRQLWNDLFLGTAQHERTQSALQALQALLVSVGNGLLVVVLKGLRTAQQAWCSQ
ncbi:hypothetical protein D3C74_265540 [compost metagenome]